MNTLVTTVLQYTWPILDPPGEPLTRAEILAHGYPALEDAAEENHCSIVGHPLWRVQDAAITGGWESWKGRVLIALVPVVNYGAPETDFGEPLLTRAEWDEIHAGEIAEAEQLRQAEIEREQQKTAERDAQVRRLHAAGLTMAEMQRVLKLRYNPVMNALLRCGLQPHRRKKVNQKTKLGPCLTPQRYRIRELYLAGLTVSEISRALDERSTVVTQVIGQVEPAPVADPIELPARSIEPIVLEPAA